MLNLYGSFLTLIFAFYWYETLVIDSSYLQYKVQLPTSDATEITAGGIKVRLKGPVPIDAPYRKNTFVLDASS